MTKFKTIIFVLCLTIGASLVFANNTDFGKTDGRPITVVKANGHGGEDRSSTIIASINGHNLTIDFIDDIGPVTIKITDDSEVTLDIDYRETPTGYLYFIPSTGHYVIVITLSNDDEYEGEFDVTD